MVLSFCYKKRVLSLTGWDSLPQQNTRWCGPPSPGLDPVGRPAAPLGPTFLTLHVLSSLLRFPTSPPGGHRYAEVRQSPRPAGDPSLRAQ